MRAAGPVHHGDVGAAGEVDRTDALVFAELAKKLTIGHATVARIWLEHGIQPWRSEEFPDFGSHGTATLFAALNTATGTTSFTFPTMPLSLRFTGSA